MQTSKSVLTDEHPDTLNIMNNLAMTYMNQERWTEAEELRMQVVQTMKRVLNYAILQRSACFLDVKYMILCSAYV